MLGVQDINQNKMLPILSNYFMQTYVLLSTIWLTGWKSHFDYAKKFLDKKSNMHLTVEKCVCPMTQKHKQNHVNVSHNRL